MERIQWWMHEVPPSKREKIGEMVIPLPFVCATLPQHVFQSSIKVLYHPICLGMVGRCLDVVNSNHGKELSHQGGSKVCFPIS